MDVSEQKALETKFAQSQKMQAVGQLAGGVAHDFNNLLTVIIGNCEFLLMRHQAGDPSFKEINEVHQNALRAAALVSQLLAFSRKQTMQPKTLALGEVVGELAQMLRRLVGKGTTFNIYLPRRHLDAVEAAPVEAAPLVARDVTGQDTILLVEDEEAVRSFAARALRMRGYQVLEAGGGEEALEIVKAGTSKIDLIITDVVMPNMDGPTMVRAVKAMNPALPVIFMSGYAEEAFRRNDQNSEDIHFLPKPFGLKQLAAKVKEVLSA